MAIDSESYDPGREPKDSVDQDTPKPDIPLRASA